MPIDADYSADAIEGKSKRQLNRRQKCRAHDRQERRTIIDEGDNRRGGDLHHAERQLERAAISAITGQPHQRAAARHAVAAAKWGLKRSGDLANAVRTDDDRWRGFNRSLEYGRLNHEHRRCDLQVHRSKIDTALNSCGRDFREVCRQVREAGHTCKRTEQCLRELGTERIARLVPGLPGSVPVGLLDQARRVGCERIEICRSGHERVEERGVGSDTRQECAQRIRVIRDVAGSHYRIPRLLAAALY